MLPSGDPSQLKVKHRLNVKGWKIVLQATGIQRKAGVAAVTSDKTNFKPKIM